MQGARIRSEFLRFFKERGHEVVPSAALVPERDPTLMFANAGMVPFKRLFLGEEQRPYRRAASSQKCMRVSGKHNDLEEVGRTPRHHTFFEMLGNFSFGDYFKSEAIAYAWEFLTGVLRIDPDRLVVSVFEEDDEAFALWRDQVGIPESRIYRLGASENFWAMGDTGPCGPCSEIHVVRRPACEKPDCNPSCGCGRFLEIWNLVFMQFEQRADGSRVPLPKPSIDTGMGLERVASVLQNVASNYDTDLFQPILARASELSGRAYGSGPESDVSLRVVADHVRACTFLIGDGVLPSNEGRGYVLRRVLRRAARHGVLLGVERPFLYDVADAVIEHMSGAYPELAERRAFVQDTIRREEERFLRTLGRGLALLDDEIARVRVRGRGSLEGAVVFKLYDTFGFPRDLTEDILRSHALDYDRAGFDACMREQAERARAAWQGSGQSAPLESYGALERRAGATRFLGYETLDAKSTLLGLLVGGAEAERVGEGERAELAVAETPFYAESGGQVGDTGVIVGPGGQFEVEDTQRPLAGLVVHSGRVTLGELRRGDAVELRVNAARRAATVRNHSATHLLHHALRRLLGPQVQQAGSRVAPDRLRFDFTHDAPLSAAQLRELEDLVNGAILANHRAQVVEASYAEAIESGAIAIFEEKYGDRVRVVRFGDSVELCGGTHAHATGDIGTLRITGQAAVGAGVRRLEAQTGFGALEYARRESEALAQAAQLLRTSPAELGDRIARLLEHERTLEKELERARSERLRGRAADPLDQARDVAGVRVLAAELPDASAKDLRGLVDELKQRLGSGIVLLASRQDGKASLAMGVTHDLTARFPAGQLIGPVSEPVGGRGGGRPDFAQAGGPNADAIPAALERLSELVAARAAS